MNRILLVTLASLALLCGCDRRSAPPPAQAPAAPAQPGFTGAGASFPAPLYTRWAADYHKATGVRINYQSIGSGAGIRQVEARTVDFGASDAPLKDEALLQKGLVQFPMVIGGVVPVVNIKGIEPGQLRLTGQVLGDIYLGKVKRWDDPAITALNPGLPLPDAAITPIRRADGAGTTFLFTSFLSQANAQWKARIGEGTAVNWPAGAGGKGNEGVAAFVGRLPNTIGYVEYAYVKQNRMKYVLLQNAAGAFVAPQDASFQAAAAGADWSRSFHQVLTNRPGAASWPITGATFILMPATETRAGQAEAVVRFFDWAYASGDATAAGLGYVPMPEAVKALVRKAWQEKVRDAAGAPVAPR